MIQLVVFDMAGTTVLDNDAVHYALINALKKFGYEVTREEANKVMGISKPLAIQLILSGQGVDSKIITEEHIQAIYGSFLSIMMDYYHFSPEVLPTNNAEEIFQLLKAAGIKVGLDTGFSKEIAQVIVNRLGWIEKGYIDVVIGSDEVAQGRPAPLMIQKIMEITGVTDIQAVAKVGDTSVDLKEGTNAGCGYVIGVCSGAYTREELQKYPHTHLIDNLIELKEILFAQA